MPGWVVAPELELEQRLANTASSAPGYVPPLDEGEVVIVGGLAPLVRLQWAAELKASIAEALEQIG